MSEKEGGKNGNITIRVEQDETQFQAKVIAEQRDENSAKTLASGLQMLLVLGSSKAEGDEAVLIKSTNATSEGKDLCLTFASPKKVVSEMIQRKLAEQKKSSNISGQS